MEEPINITMLNDYLFCPISIYYHNVYDDMEKNLYQTSKQINGTEAHKAIDYNKYSTSANVLQGVSVYSEKYNLIGKIDVFDINKGCLIERKKKISVIYDGYIFQLYGQFYSLTEMGYKVNKLKLYSMDDNKTYDVKLPTESLEMRQKFEKVIFDINHFDFDTFVQNNRQKCLSCIYEPCCGGSLK